jgi:hypothetical protein
MAKRPEVLQSAASVTETAPQARQALAMPNFVEFSAHGSAVGKTFTSRRLRYYLSQAGQRSIMVRIESRGIDPKLEEGDVFIPTEDFSRAGELPGGLVGVLTPLYAAIRRAREEGAVLILDWPSGLARHRLEIMAATRFDERLAGMGMTGLSLIVTTNATDRMAQAGDNLAMLEKVAPGLQRGLVLNCRTGDFDFATGSEQKREFDALLKTAPAALITIPLLRGGCWKMAEEAGLTMPEAMRLTPAELAGRLNTDEFIAAACATEIEAWWQLTEVALTQVARFPEAAH